MNHNVWCKMLNLHKYEIIQEEKRTDSKGNIIGKVIVSRCYNCGKIKQTIIYTEEGHEKY